MSIRGKFTAWVRELVDRMVPGGSLHERTVKSGVWASATNFLSRGLALLTLVILARLIGPNAFGLMGIALLTLTGLKQFSQLGLNTALIQRESDNVDAYLNTAWTMRIARGIILGVILVGTAPFIAEFFGEPKALPILQAIALSPVLIGLRIPGVIYFRKSLEFHKHFLHKMSGSTSRFIVSVGIAIVEPTVWALVVGFIAADAMMVVTSFLLHDHRPKPSMEWDRARDLFGYGKWITGTGMLYYVFRQGDDIVVGAVLAASSLGLYQMAYQLSNAPATEVSQVVSSVVFPSFSKLQNQPAQLREAFFKTLRLITVVSFPMAAGILAVAPSFVPGVMGKDWVPMVATIQILAVFGLFRSFGGIFGTVYKAVGRPDLTTKLMGINVLVLSALIYPTTTTYGIEGAAMAVLVSLIVKTIINVYLVVDIIGTSYRRLLTMIAYPLAGSAVMGGLIILMRRWLPVDSSLIEFVLLVPAGVLLYLGSILLIDRISQWGITDEVATVVGTVKG